MNAHTKQQQDKVFETDFIDSQKSDPPFAHLLALSHNSAIPRKYLQAHGAVHYQQKNPLDNQKSPSTINAYIIINITKSQDDVCHG